MKKKQLFLSLVTHVSGKWNNGTKTGTFYLNLNNDTTNRNRNISGHLVYARYIFEF